MNKKVLNKDLRKRIVEIITEAKEGHIPSSLSIIDIINYIYEKKINFQKLKKHKLDRDYFFLSKGHAAVALFVVLEKFKLITVSDLNTYGNFDSKYGGHPDKTKIKYVEASTGSLGHGFPSAVGCALGLKIQSIGSKVYCLIGDGESHEGTIWESANIAANNNLNNLTVILDRNKSAQQLLKIENLEKKWRAFGWNVFVFNGHNKLSINKAFKKKFKNNKPTILIANTIKGYGIKMMEGHGAWHHKIPNQIEYKQIMKELK